MGVVRLKCTLRYFCAMIMVILVLYDVRRRQTDTFIQTSRRRSISSEIITCQIPYLTPFNITQDDGILTAPRCYNSFRQRFHINFQNQLIRSEPIPKYWRVWGGNQSICYYSPVVRIPDEPDMSFKRETPIQINDSVTILNPDVDHIHIWCKASNITFYEDYLSLVQRKPELESKLDAANGGKEFFSVMIIGQDASSHMNFLRTMPRVHKFLKTKLDAVEFHGFNSLGPTTLWSMNPFLTGLELIEFTNACYGDNSFKETCPFIWKEFEKQGYRTAYDEDRASVSLFRPVGFQPFLRQPFHYDFRPVALQFAFDIESPNYCSGPTLSIQVLLNNMVKMAEAFHDKPYWAMMWAQYLSHFRNGLSKFGEPSMLSALEHLHENQLLNNTILIMLSDHGMWWRDFYTPSEATLLEQRLPILYVALPPKFKNKFPLATKNLRENSRKLTTTYDVYEMMKDLLNLTELTDERIKARAEAPSVPTRRNVSLFLPINPKRTCAMAGISLINCACLPRKAVSVSEPFALRAANFVLDVINNKTEGYKKCSKLKLENITEVFLTGTNSKDRRVKDYFLKGLKIKTLIKESHGDYFEIGLSTKPGRGKYYAAVISNGFDGHFTLAGIARTSIYGDDANCMALKELKPYCYCGGDKVSQI